MKVARVNLSNEIIILPVEYLDQQTAISSVFDNVPIDRVDMDALIEANKHGVAWYYRFSVDEKKKALHISVPTELIKWEE